MISCTFETDRLDVSPLTQDQVLESLAKETLEILAPEVTQSLPPGWQSIFTEDESVQWLQDRMSESTFLIVRSKDERSLIGFIFLFVEDEQSVPLEIRFGYLLRKQAWGKGFGTEVLKGFVNWCEKSGEVRSISGGVAKENIGSIKVLEKVGFSNLSSLEEDVHFYTYHFH